jgi:hypothetical protein
VDDEDQGEKQPERNFGASKEGDDTLINAKTMTSWKLCIVRKR